MGDSQRNCGSDHRFREHGIGAGLTRRICTRCGLLKIGQGRRVAVTDHPWGEEPLPIIVNAS